MSEQNDQATNKYDSIFSLMAKFFWMLLGNAVLFITTIFIFQHKGGIFHSADIVFWVTAGILVIVRYLDIKFLHGITVMGLPATTADWKKYATRLLVCSTAVWVLAHAINYLVVNR